MKKIYIRHHTINIGGFKVHCCLLDRSCWQEREDYGFALRLYWATPWKSGFFDIVPETDKFKDLMLKFEQDKLG